MRFGLACCLIGLSLAGLCTAQESQASIRQETNIPAEPLDQALRTLAKERQFQVLYRAELVHGVHSNGAVGEYTPEEALKQLLSGTALSYKYLDASTVTIVPIALVTAGATSDQAQTSPNSAPDSSKEAGKKSSQDFRVAQVDQGQTSSPTTVETQDAQTLKKKPFQLQEVVVTGSRLPRAAEEGPQDVKIYNRENIDQSGQVNVGDFLNTLPDVSISNTSNVYQAGNGTGSTVQLHGLPVGTTLVLINGRRVETSGSQQYSNFFDLNSVPLAAIERIEVLPEGSSAIYGADAIGGVVNIILRDNFDGFEANAKYGYASGTDEANGALAWGRTWERGSMSIIASTESQSQLFGWQRTLTASNNYTAYGGPNNNFPTCTPGNIFSTNGGNLPGLNAPYAAVPAGFQGTPSIQEFRGTAGTLNECGLGAYTDLIPTTHRQAVMLSGKYNLTASVTLFTELLYSHVNTAVDLGPSSDFFGEPGFQSFTVSPSNPFNPFGETVGIAELSPPEFINSLTTDFVRPLVGARGSLLDKWHWELAAWDSQDRSTQSSEQLNESALQAALNSTNSATALNPFVAGPPGSPQLLQSLSYPTYTLLTGQMLGVNGFVRGPAVQLPAGPLELVVGAEYNYNRLHSDAASTPLYPASVSTYQRNNYAVFAESRIPILADRSSSTGRDVLALTLAGRHDHYSDFGDANTPQFGLEWRPVATLLVRGTYGKSFKAPSLYDLHEPITTEQAVVLDPARGNQGESVTVTQGGNPNLRPETGQSRTLGLVYSSDRVAGLQVAATYWAVDEAENIQFLDLATLVDYANLFPGFVTRASSCASGPPCPIVQVNDVYVNFGEIRTAGFDYKISYEYASPFGQITPSLSAAQTTRYTVSLTPGAPAIDADSKAQDTGNWAPRWKGTIAIGWKLGPYTATMDGRYVGRYQDYDSTREIGNFWISDANFRIAVGDAFAGSNYWLKGSYVAFGAVNLFNKLPQFSNYLSGFVGYDPAQSDIRGRFLYAQLGVKY